MVLRSVTRMQPQAVKTLSSKEVACLQLSQTLWRRNLWLIWVALFISNMGFSLVMPFLPLYVQTMGIAGHSVELWTGVIFSATYVSAAVVLPYWGRLSDRKGRRPIMIGASIGQGVAVTLMGLATHPWQLVVLRLLLGASFGILSACIAYMTAITPKAQTGYMLGMIQAAVTAGGILGPFLGGFLASFMGYQPIFFLNGLACFLQAAVFIFFVKEQFTPQVSQGTHSRLADDVRVVAASPTLMAMMVVAAVQCFSIMNAEPIIPLYLQTLHVPPSLLTFLSGAVFSVVGIATAMASPFLGRMGDRMGYKHVLMVCLGGVAVMYALQGLATNWWTLLLFRFGQGCFAGGVFAASNALTSLASSRSFQGRAFSLSASAQQVGNFLGPLVGSAVAAGVSFRAVFPITGLLCIANLLWVWRLVPKTQVSAPDDADDGGLLEPASLPMGH
jgi:MFS transporter, DHA1 family, multidrug resistance protein